MHEYRIDVCDVWEVVANTSQSISATEIARMHLSENVFTFSYFSCIQTAHVNSNSHTHTQNIALVDTNQTVERHE